MIFLQCIEVMSYSNRFFSECCIHELLNCVLKLVHIILLSLNKKYCLLFHFMIWLFLSSVFSWLLLPMYSSILFLFEEIETYKLLVSMLFSCFDYNDFY